MSATFTTVVEQAEDSNATGLRVPAAVVAALGAGKLKQRLWWFARWAVLRYNLLRNPWICDRFSHEHCDF